MSKPIDQDLLPCPFCGGSARYMPADYVDAHGEPWPFAECESCSTGAPVEFWNKRASVQPAGVVVPDADRLHVKDALLMWNRRHEQPPIKIGFEYGVAEALMLMLAAAPHPVSGEQKPDALRKRFSDIEDEIMAGKHNAASVFTAMRTAALYIGQPAAQEVAGLVEALEAVIAYDDSAEDEEGSLMMHYGDMLKKVRDALAAHRAQQGEQS